MNPSNYVEFTDTFLDIVSKVNEKEIEILDYCNQNSDKNEKVNYTTFGIDKNTYNFYIQDLISKCLLIDDSINRYDTRPLDMVKITEFGKDFLDFIKDN
ncbi:hypothetical protein [Caloranaerobacter sp. DY30410]|uniref:hypothetical protein n=1 Tax=Caloranaerobacter sp. DY30410 TaxID=3238305 RepID=UPI003CFE41F8